MNAFTKLAALGAVAAASSPFALATTVTPGGLSVVAMPVTVNATNIVASTSGTLTAESFTGSYTEYVIDDASNPYNSSCGSTGCLTFLITVANDGGSPNGIEHIANGDGLAGFNIGPSVNVGFLASSTADGTDVPATVDETIFGTVEFNFTGIDAIEGGTGTEYLVIQTAASNYALGNLAAIDSSSDTEMGYVPAANTPEPSSLVLLGTGLMGAAGMVFKRRRFAPSI